MLLPWKCHLEKQLIFPRRKKECFILTTHLRKKNDSLMSTLRTWNWHQGAKSSSSSSSYHRLAHLCGEMQMRQTQKASGGENVQLQSFSFHRSGEASTHLHFYGLFRAVDAAGPGTTVCKALASAEAGPRLLCIMVKSTHFGPNTYMVIRVSQYIKFSRLVVVYLSLNNFSIFTDIPMQSVLCP